MKSTPSPRHFARGNFSRLSVSCAGSRNQVCASLSILRDPLAHPLDQLMDVVLVAREIRGEIGALGQAHTGALRKQSDDLWPAGGRTDNPVHSVGRVSR